jgi:teichuronic acid biosynthesis glycosyltransferase TuaC
VPGDAAGHFVEAEVLERRAAGDSVLVFAPGISQPGDPERGLIRVPSRGLFGTPGAVARFRENPLRGIGAVELVLRAPRLLHQLGPFDEIVAHWLIPSAWPIACSGRGRLEAVAHGSDVRLLAKLPTALRRHIGRRLLEAGARVRCVSEHVRAGLLAAAPELAPRIVVAPSPFELPVLPGRTELRARLGVDSGKRLVVVVARLVPDKRVDVALAATAELPATQVVVVGDGPLRERLRRRHPEVRFTGELPRPEALRWIAAADVLISASLLEGAPTAIREARALGTPVVACEAGSLAQLAAGDAGIWLVQHTDAARRANARG